MLTVSDVKKYVEAKILGAFLLEDSAIEHMGQLLQRDDFFTPMHKEIYQAMTQLRARGEPVDEVTVAHEMQTQEVHGQKVTDYIAELAESAIGSADVISSARLLIAWPDSQAI